MSILTQSSHFLRTPLWWRFCVRILIGFLLLLSGYSIILMYARGEIALALVMLVLIASAWSIFARRAYVYRYIFPSIMTLGLFMVLPILYTVHIAFSNYSGKNMLTLEQSYRYLLAQTQYQQDSSFDFKLYTNDKQQFKIILKTESEQFETPFFKFNQDLKAKHDILVEASHTRTPLTLQEVSLKKLVQLRAHLKQLELLLPTQNVHLSMSSLRRFSALEPLYEPVQSTLVLASGAEIQDDWLLRQKATGQLYRPNRETGFYQALNPNGEFTSVSLAPGFVVAVGWDNFARILTDPGLQEPFIQILIWTIIFAALTVVLTLFLGLILASVVQWELLRGRSLYRILLILPYAVPAFISILVFKGLFNQNFGEINLFLEALFGIKPNWFTDPLLAKAMILIVNVWLGYPYMMILSMGLLKSIPEELYEASAMDGAGPINNFFHITLPMLIKPLAPLLIACFAFNFNNFVLIQLLTEGKPDILGASTPAGTTDLLVSYTYRIAFEGGGGQNYALASAIATLIFLVVGGLSLFNLKLSKISK